MIKNDLNRHARCFDMIQNTEKKSHSDLGLMTAEKYYGKLARYPPLKSSDRYLDKLLGGGFQKGLVHLLIGSKKRNSEILLRTAVRGLMPSNGGSGIHKVAYIDGNNRFSPYLVSKTALSLNMNPRDMLEKIYVARAFNWSQIVEILEVKLAKMRGIGLILISGITSMFEPSTEKRDDLNQKAFSDLKSSINGIKNSIKLNHDPIVVISASKHENSLHKPVGGKILTHFGCVIVEFIEKERYTDYILAQHPFMPQKHVIKWNRISDKIKERYVRWNIDPKNDGKKHLKLKEEWKNMIQQPKSDGFVKDVRNLRLKEKRNRTNKKRNNTKSQGLTLDFYLNK